MNAPTRLAAFAVAAAAAFGIGFGIGDAAGPFEDAPMHETPGAGAGAGNGWHGTEEQE